MTKIYFPSLNGLRFIAALSVIIYHFYGLEVLNGHLGVVLFFVLSGFLITYLLFEEKDTTKKIEITSFYWRRILRIWPLYFFIVIIATIVYLQKNNFCNYLEILPYFLFFIPNVAFVLEIPFKYAGILWSVGSEEQFYGFWPWLFKCKTNLNILYLFLIIIVFFTLTPHFLDYVRSHFFNNNKFLYYISHILQRMNFSCMAIGGVLAYIARYHYRILVVLFNPLIQWLNISLLFFSWIMNIEYFFNDQVYAISFGILIVNLALNAKSIFSLEFQVLNFLGKISFGLYVYHLIAIDLIKLILQKSSTDVLLIIEFILVLLLTIILSFLSYILIEKPFLKMKKKRFTLVVSGEKE